MSSTSQWIEFKFSIYGIDVTKLWRIFFISLFNIVVIRPFPFFNVDYILSKFNEIAEKGADLIYIDSYHENHHVLKLLDLWFKYLNKDGAIFIDDVDSFPFRKKKDIWNSIVYDLTDDAIKNFYYSNQDKILYTKYFGENGLAKLKKLTNLFDEPNANIEFWNYNILFKILYPYLRFIKKIKFW